MSRGLVLLVADDEAAAVPPGEVPPGQVDQGGDAVKAAEQGDQVQPKPGQPGGGAWGAVSVSSCRIQPKDRPTVTASRSFRRSER